MFLCITDPLNNFDIIPDFENIISDDFHLQSGSQLINIGLTNVSPISNIDLDYHVRFNNNIDLGAYEWSPSSARKTKIDTINSYDIQIYPNPTSSLYIQYRNT